ncbi:Translation initiation factor 2 [hydrothermal vent metagenome]|uniref:Translation initiation factor 2 n=1 Tax=hydrothermal vent metagenome TaxID=652676 RepID=A0A3B0VKZ9_9ZZZZ
MTENEKEIKGKIVEKRIKKTVIRRRAVKPTPAEKAAAQEAVKAAEVVAAAPPEQAVAEEAVAASPAPAEKVKERKTSGAGSKKAAAAPPSAATPRPAPAQADGAREDSRDKDKGKVKREVKVFNKEVKKVDRTFPGKQMYRRGKRYQVRDNRRRSNISPSRELKKTEITVTKTEKRVVKIAEAISVGEFSQKIGVKANEIIRKLMDLGIMATVNQTLDIESATIIAQNYDYEVESVALQEETLLEAGINMEELGEGELRAPVVTVMGHVDHGKTSLLDAIRRTNVVSDEAGGITQHIGAYHVHLDKGDVTFLDTPGHEAFTAMRARGARATDIVVLVVAANDGVMPQTIEAINHAKAAEVPIIVAINKIDLPEANPEKIRQSLTEYGLVSEDWGGDTIFVEVSAKKEQNITSLLEMILLQAEILELKANVGIPASGIVVESRLDKGKGPVATVLIQNGTLKVGDTCVAGEYFGKIRAMISDWGKRVPEAGPSMPVKILGLSGVPEAGDTFSAVKDESTARQVTGMRHRKARELEQASSSKISLADLYEQITAGEVKELNVVVKADVQGSMEAVRDALLKLSTEKVGLKVIHNAVGGINEGDVMLASASNAIIIGFNVRPDVNATQICEKENVDLRLYNIIYNLTDDIRNAMEGLLEPIIREETIGTVEVREVFKVTKVGTIAGAYVTDGKVARNAKVRLVRDSVVIYEGSISSLKRFKEDTREVSSGYECGIGIEGYNDIKVGDVIEAFVVKEEAARL